MYKIFINVILFFTKTKLHKKWLGKRRWFYCISFADSL